MDELTNIIDGLMDLFAENPGLSWAVLGLSCIVLVWLVGRSARVARY